MEAQLRPQEVGRRGRRTISRQEQSVGVDRSRMDDRDDLTLELAKDALAVVSPDEMQLIDAVGPELLQSVDAGGRGDGSLGFGFAEVAMSTAALYASRAVVEMLVEIGRDVAKDEAKGFLRKAAGAIRARRSKQVDAQEMQEPLPTQYITGARQQAYDRAIAVGLDEGRASLLADAISESLRTAV